jgi:hypothetical protein
MATHPPTPKTKSKTTSLAHATQGERVARNPAAYIMGGALLLALCLAGLARFRLQTDPQHLWVAPSSQAAQEKARYEASFGPFYRVEQLLLSTTPASAANFTSASGLPAIVTPDNIELLFSMQAEVDAIAARLEGGEGGRLRLRLRTSWPWLQRLVGLGARALGLPKDAARRVLPAGSAAVCLATACCWPEGPPAALPAPGAHAPARLTSPPLPPPAGQARLVSLEDICYKPFGGACATQSLLQFWKMDRAFYTREQARGARLTPDYCFGHWYTQCRWGVEGHAHSPSLHASSRNPQTTRAALRRGDGGDGPSTPSSKACSAGAAHLTQPSTSPRPIPQVRL